MTGFSSKISHKRFHNSGKNNDNLPFPVQLNGSDRVEHCNTITFQCESDRGRIINSAAVRRLQQKTQVFPLERNAAVRSRLTHSMEVMQVGRFIARSVISKLKKDDTRKQDIEGLEQALESLVEMSCLMHDVGNPPFGHFGEKAIQDWLTDNLVNCMCKSFNIHRSKFNPDNELMALISDLTHFEGNAQGIRIITNLQKLNLTKTQIASVLKYTRCGTEEKPSNKLHPLFYLLKKVGYYFSEKAIVDDVTEFHGLARNHRHPIAYIMEAADDISYCIADLEDAVDKNLLTVDTLKTLLLEEYEKLTINKDFSNQNANFNDDKERMKKLLSSNENWHSYDSNDTSQFFISTRAKFVVELVQYATEMIVKNLDSILNGSYSGHILEDDSYQSRIAKAMKNVAVKHVFNHREVEANELKGYTVISGLLDKYKPLLEASKEEFSNALNNEKTIRILLLRMCKKLPPKHLRAYKEALSCEINRKRFPNEQVMEYYYRCRLIQDLISGMTNQYALDEYRELMAIEGP
ncbi:dGTPase [Pseudoalteromonas xiamenensis]